MGLFPCSTRGPAFPLPTKRNHISNEKRNPAFAAGKGRSQRDLSALTAFPSWDGLSSTSFAKGSITTTGRGVYSLRRGNFAKVEIPTSFIKGRSHCREPDPGAKEGFLSSMGGDPTSRIEGIQIISLIRNVLLKTISNQRILY